MAPDIADRALGPSSGRGDLTSTAVVQAYIQRIKEVNATRPACVGRLQHCALVSVGSSRASIEPKIHLRAGRSQSQRVRRFRLLGKVHLNALVAERFEAALAQVNRVGQHCEMGEEMVAVSLIQSCTTNEERLHRGMLTRLRQWTGSSKPRLWPASHRNLVPPGCWGVDKEASSARVISFLVLWTCM